MYDIPFPENLYVVKQALEGYRIVYEHSKSFFVEENQICVDEHGIVKIWINGDLSINYPSVLGPEAPNFGEEEMVDMLMHIVADNTDQTS